MQILLLVIFFLTSCNVFIFYLYNIFEECLGCLVVLEIVIVTLLQEKIDTIIKRGRAGSSFKTNPNLESRHLKKLSNCLREPN